MASTGDRFEMPDGSVYAVTRAADDPRRDSVEMEFVLPKGCVPPLPHVHPEQVERYQVLDGSFEVMLDGDWQALGPGESASVPAGALHTFRNRSGAEVRVRNWHEPAMRFEDFIERVHTTLAEAGVKGKRDPRSYMLLSMVMLEFEETLAPARPQERIPLRVLAWAGRLISRRRRAPG